MLGYELINPPTLSFQVTNLAFLQVVLIAEIIVSAVLVIVGVAEAWMLALLLVIIGLGLLSIKSKKSSKKSNHTEPNHHHDKVIIESKGKSHPLTKLQSRQVSPLLELDELHKDQEHSHGNEETIPFGLIKSFIFYIQLLTALLGEHSLPTWLSKLISLFAFVNFKLSGVECISPQYLSTPTGKLVFYQAMLPTLVLLSAMLVVLRHLLHRQRLAIQRCCCRPCRKVKPSKMQIVAPDQVRSAPFSIIC